jgi:hypothetical protein
MSFGNPASALAVRVLGGHNADMSTQRHERLHSEEHAEKTDGRPELLHSVIGLYQRVMNCEG